MSAAGPAPALPSALYIPNAAPLQPPLFTTDDFVSPTDYVYHVNTGRLLMVGNPYFSVPDADKDRAAVPKVSGNQYRVFRLKLPDPNDQFDLPDGLFDPEKFRYVWQLVGLEVCRGQPLGVGISAAPAFNKGRDVESPARLVADDATREDDNRVSVGLDPKQNQMLIVGCAPAYGQHWGKATPCPDDTLDTQCPPIELISSTLQDGDMCDIGFGCMDFAALAANTSDIPLELINTVSKYPDWIRMHNDPKGDCCFFLMRREQLYARHMWQHSGGIGEAIPSVYLNTSFTSTNNCAYMCVPSGSVYTSDTQLFNRPYWLSKAQGPNNGVCWGDDLFITVLDNTRGGVMNISTKPTDSGDVYKPSDFREYVRHVEEYELSCVLRLCKVPLSPDVLASLYRAVPHVLGRWGISEYPQADTTPEDKYRYISSQATRCPLPAADTPTPVQDPWADMTFWTVDCTSRISPELPRFPLGRKFLALPGPRPATPLYGKRSATAAALTGAAGVRSAGVRSGVRTAKRRRR
ncbi:major capsid protein L1 [Psittacus erithacus papillomavirus 1]|uniref:Major capsid protein L1 n=2 Tax=Psittacus erithacus timneh papillomavirus TaxID=197772 RepID=Q8JJF6_PEPVA|nr:major capsid protein L1 [Psittacus erithacus papillomavirus 1]AAM46857.1 major capsid protein L1 [Psittacus erithacus papillomavirus 1]AAM75205.1 putative major capsid protein L1 [Thetapapillomavirus 1]